MTLMPIIDVNGDFGSKRKKINSKCCTSTEYAYNFYAPTNKKTSNVEHKQGIDETQTTSLKENTAKNCLS